MKNKYNFLQEFWIFGNNKNKFPKKIGQYTINYDCLDNEDYDENMLSIFIKNFNNIIPKCINIVQKNCNRYRVKLDSVCGFNVTECNKKEIEIELYGRLSNSNGEICPIDPMYGGIVLQIKGNNIKMPYPDEVDVF